MARKVLKQASLGAFSKQMAFYHLFLEEEPGRFVVRKESGTLKSGICDRREWRERSYAAAEKIYHRKLRQKTNPNRKSIRIYKIKPENRLSL